MRESKTHLSKHDLDLVKRNVRMSMSGGFSQVYGWAGEGFKEHWADSIVLNMAIAREGLISTEWLYLVKIAVYKELRLDTVDVPR